jgi:hypothetical protein
MDQSRHDNAFMYQARRNGSYLDHMETELIVGRLIKELTFGMKALIIGSLGLVG